VKRTRGDGPGEWGNLTCRVNPGNRWIAEWNTGYLSTRTRVPESLRGKGIAAEHVHEALSEGVDDTEVDVELVLATSGPPGG
jgi:hypothetical protein